VLKWKEPKGPLTKYGQRPLRLHTGRIQKIGVERTEEKHSKMWGERGGANLAWLCNTSLLGVGWKKGQGERCIEKRRKMRQKYEQHNTTHTETIALVGSVERFDIAQSHVPPPRQAFSKRKSNFD
jgi:hypothetical protein